MSYLWATRCLCVGKVRNRDSAAREEQLNSLHSKHILANAEEEHLSPFWQPTQRSGPLFAN